MVTELLFQIFFCQRCLECGRHFPERSHSAAQGRNGQPRERGPDWGCCLLWRLYPPEHHAAFLRIQHKFEGTRALSAVAAEIYEEEVFSLGLSEPTPIRTHMRKARAGLAALIERERRTETDKESDRALRWLAENRQKYAARWIALRGAELLVAGNTASEVYDVSEENSHPSVGQS